MKKSGSGFFGPQPRGLPPELVPALRAPAVRDVVHVHAARAHRGDVRRQVVALQDDVADASARLDETGQVCAPAPRALGGGALLRRVADRQQLEVLLFVERDRVVGAPAGMDAARLDVEAQAAVLLDTPLEAGNTNHQVVDSGEHKAEAPDPSGYRTALLPEGRNTRQLQQSSSNKPLPSCK
jgi:hypothetical protein